MRSFSEAIFFDDEHNRVFQDRFHLLRVGHEIGRQEAPIELHAFDNLQNRLRGLRFLDRDDAFAADLLHRLADQFTDERVVVRGDRCHLLFLAAGRNRSGYLLERLYGPFCCTIETTFDIDRAGAGDNVAHAVGEYRMGQNGRRAGAVPDHVPGFLGRLPEHPRAKVLLGILQVEFLGDGHPVVADDGGAPFLFDQDRLRARPERDAHGVGELGRATKDLFARRGTKQHLLVSHDHLRTAVCFN